MHVSRSFYLIFRPKYCAFVWQEIMADIAEERSWKFLLRNSVHLQHVRNLTLDVKYFYMYGCTLSERQVEDVACVMELLVGLEHLTLEWPSHEYTQPQDENVQLEKILEHIPVLRLTRLNICRRFPHR